MDMTNIKNDVGFVRADDIFDRFRFRTPPDGEYYVICRPPKGGRFASVGVLCYKEFVKLFLIYAGERELYDHICQLAAQAAEKIGLGFEVKAEVWDESE